MNVKCGAGSPRGGPVTSERSRRPGLTVEPVWVTLVFVVRPEFGLASFLHFGLVCEAKMSRLSLRFRRFLRGLFPPTAERVSSRLSQTNEAKQDES